MDWRKYEKEIFDAFCSFYPDAKISFDQRLLGRYSKIERQIDVLIEGRIAGKNIRLIVDGKYYGENIDVKEVESFISMAEDVNATQGILVTSKGYSQAATNRAYYGPSDIELDILNFDELLRFQGFGGNVTSGSHGAIIPAPFGWVVDGTRRENTLANFYQRGKSYEEAFDNGEFIYVNIFPYDAQVTDVEKLLEHQKERTLERHPRASFTYSESVERTDGSKTLIRKIVREETDLEEYSGFVCFETFTVFCVLLTPKEASTKNVRKLEYMLERMIPMAVNLQSVALVEISQRRRSLENTETDEDKANILMGIAQIHRDLEQFDIAEEVYFESMEVLPNNYGARLGLLELGFRSGKWKDLVDDFYNVSPGKLQICGDLVRLSIENNQNDFFNDFFERKTKEHVGEFEKLGCVYCSWADLKYSLDDNKSALDLFTLAHENFIQCFDSSHSIVIAMQEAIDELSSIPES